jgi:putative ABC transport system permease protein
MKNNNQKVIRKLSYRSIQTNRLRNTFACIAISLTALLFTALLSIGIGMIQVSEEQTMRQIGTKAHAGLKDVTIEEYQKISSHPLVKDSSYNIIIGVATNEELIKRQTEIRYTQSHDLDFGFTELKKGNLPTKEDEIVVDTIVMDMLNVPHQVGVKITLSFPFMGKDYNETFTVSGWYEGDPVIGASQVYLSKAYLDKISQGFTEEDFVKASKENSIAIGLIQGSIVFKNARNIEPNVIKIIEESGYSIKNIRYGINWGYLTEQSQDLDFVSTMIIVVAFLVMMLTGYLIIYNIFQISIMKDIRFFGLLKTVGATKKQIRRLVRRQVLLLSCIGLPIGLILGYLVGNIMMPIFLKAASGLQTTNFQIRPNPLIFLFGTVFTFITVIISCRKPSKIAGSVSPIEATKYADVKVGRRKKKQTTGGAKLSRMALSNMARNKKKTSIVILSLSLSIILLTEVVTFSRSFSIDEYLENMITGDFTICSVSLLNFHANNIDIKLPEDFYDFMKKQEGIESASKMYVTEYMDHSLSDKGLTRFKELYENDKLDIYEGPYTNLPVVQSTIEKNIPIDERRYAYDESLLNKLEVLDGKFDMEKYKTGNYILVAPLMDMNTTYYKPGDKVELSFRGPDSRQVELKGADGSIIKYYWENDIKRTYEVMAIVDIPYSMTIRNFPVNALTTVLPLDEVLKYDKQGVPFAVSFLVDDEKEANIQSLLEDYTTKIDPNTDFESKESLRDEFGSLTSTFSIIGGALSFVIGFIGVLNFINTMLTSVITRRREFAMLQSIGLTNSQLKRMLLYEGLYYIGFTGVISFIIGSLLSVLVVRAFNNIAAYFVYQFTVMPFIAVMPIFIVIAIIVPYIAYYSAKKQSIVERLREGE